VMATIDLLSLGYFVTDARAGAVVNGLGIDRFADLCSRTPCTATFVVIGVIAAVTFARRPGQLWAGALALGALAVLSTVHAQLYGSPWRHLYFSGVCLLGWLLGLGVARWHGAPTDESYAQVGSIALLAAAYLNGGLSKLVYSGVDWVWGAPIQAIIVAQDGLVQDSIMSAYRSWVVTTPGVASIFSIVTLGVEFLAPLMVVGQRTRRVVALGLFAMHANIFVLTAILYWESMVFLVLFGLATDERREESAPARTRPIPLLDHAFSGTAVVLALCAALAIVHQSRRYARAQQPTPVGAEPDASPSS